MDDFTGQESGVDDTYLLGVGQRVRSLRARRGMSRRILATSSGVSERYLAALESGKGNISILRLRQIADAMSVPVEDLAAASMPESPDYGYLLDYIRGADRVELSRLAAQLKHRSAESPRLIAFIGLRGAGKSTIGAAIAKRLAYPFVELVAAIESHAGMQVNEIFSLGGQSMYRRFERHCLEEIIARADCPVITVGGSLVSESATFERLLGSAVTVWLRASPHEHMQRVIAQGDHRPMAGHSRAMDDLKRILSERESLYRRANYIVDTTGQSVSDTLSEVIALPGVHAHVRTTEIA